MATKYKLYAVEESGRIIKEFYTLKELHKFKLSEDEVVTLFVIEFVANVTLVILRYILLGLTILIRFRITPTKRGIIVIG